MEVKPTRKSISYPHLTAEIDYEKREVKITDNGTGEFMVFPAVVYVELQAILSDIGHQAQGTQSGKR